MPNALLLPKLQLPRLPSALVLRKRLFARLDSGLECPLTLIMAPAGFGKTTLVRQWLSERSSSGAGCQSLAVAWVSLDAGDNILVLEDYHVLTSPQLHESMAFFLEHLPITLHLMILTRSEPPLSLARLRASGNVCELSATDLRFSQEETLAFLQLVVPQHISEQTLQQLDTRLEGWAVGLRLFALTLQGHVKQQAMEVSLAALNGQQRIILDYFVSEVLLVQPAPLQDFLLQTCMLDRLNSSLCDAVTGRDDSIVQLSTLERANLFLEQLDGPGQWYRYHSLFAEAMQQVARQRLGEERLRVALQQASHWYEQHNMLPEAIEKAIMAEDVARVADLIEQYMDMQRANTPASPLLDTQEFHTLRRWLEYLPATLICQRPHLCMGLVTARFLSGIRNHPLQSLTWVMKTLLI
jgi:LuxR family maltose regulon positive regulatory protein